VVTNTKEIDDYYFDEKPEKELAYELGNE